MEDLMICRSAPRKPGVVWMYRTLEFNMLPSNSVRRVKREQGPCLTREREGRLSKRAPHLSFVALDGGHGEGDGWAFQGAADCSWSLCGYKDPELVTAGSGILEMASKMYLCSSAEVIISLLSPIRGATLSQTSSLRLNDLQFFSSLARSRHTELFFVHILPLETIC